MTNRWFVIVNPVAGNCKGLHDWPIISKQLRDNSIEYDAVFTEKKHHATELSVEAVCNGYRKIIVVGGDGTLNETVHGLFIQKTVKSTDITIAVIAVGTGNDWIRIHGIARNYSEAAKAIVAGKTFLQDIAKIEYYESMVQHERYMVNMAGVGFDAVANRRYNSLKERGYYSKWLYFFSLLIAIFTYRSMRFTLKTNKEELSNKRLFTIAIGIGRYNGGGMLQAPHAVADDGLLDVTVINKMNNISILRHIFKLYDGNIYKVPNSLFLRHNVIEINSTPPTPIEVDGEALGYSPLRINNIDKALRVIVDQSKKSVE
ncbi:MAG: diacylglycerol kinase family lipid kinase [Rikenellaceae bacterium]